MISENVYVCFSKTCFSITCIHVHVRHCGIEFSGNIGKLIIDLDHDLGE